MIIRVFIVWPTMEGKKERKTAALFARSVSFYFAIARALQNEMNKKVCGNYYSSINAFTKRAAAAFSHFLLFALFSLLFFSGMACKFIAPWPRASYICCCMHCHAFTEKQFLFFFFFFFRSYRSCILLPRLEHTTTYGPAANCSILRSGQQRRAIFLPDEIG